MNDRLKQKTSLELSGPLETMEFLPNGDNSAPMCLRPSTSSATRKLSESRGIHLPDIRIVAKNSASSSIISTNRNDSAKYTKATNNVNLTMKTPPFSSSPVSHVIRHPLCVNTDRISPSNRSADRISPSNRSASAAIINICIFLPDNKGIQFAVEGGRFASAQYLVELVCEYLGIPIEIGENVFALWMISPLLEVQLKPHHIACEIRRSWTYLLQRFVNVSIEQIQLDKEPLLVFRRNVSLSIEIERQIAYEDVKTIEILYLDARDQVLNSRYVIESQEALRLAAINMTLDLGRFNSNIHNKEYIRDHLESFLPEKHWHELRSFSLFGLHIGGCRNWEQSVLSEYRLVSEMIDATTLRLAYLGIVSTLPYYGAAYFSGEMERCQGSLRDLLRSDANIEVLITINRQFICVIDRIKLKLLFVQPILDCTWKRMDWLEENQIPSFFIHFPDAEEDSESGFEIVASKLVQIISLQSVMMEALMNAVCKCRQLQYEEESEDAESIADLKVELSRSNRLDRLCVANFNRSGSCIKAQGSLKSLIVQ